MAGHTLLLLLKCSGPFSVNAKTISTENIMSRHISLKQNSLNILKCIWFRFSHCTVYTPLYDKRAFDFSFWIHNHFICLF